VLLQLKQSRQLRLSPAQLRAEVVPLGPEGFEALAITRTTDGWIEAFPVRCHKFLAR
jgi:hypothetical protein